VKTEKEIKPVEVFDGTAWQAGIVRSMLEDSGIEAFITDEIMGSMNPWYTAPGGAGSVKVFVSNLDYDKARNIVDEYEKNMK